MTYSDILCEQADGILTLRVNRPDKLNAYRNETADELVHALQAAEQDPAVRAVLMVASVAYLLYLAGRIAFAGSRLAFIEARTAPGIAAGVMLQAINPKAYAVNTALFTGFPFNPDSLPAETFAKLAIMNAIWVPIHLGWLWAGAALHRLNLGERAQRRINLAMAGAMLAVVMLAIFAALPEGG